MTSSTSGSVNFFWMSLDRPTSSLRLLQKKNISGNVDLYMRQTKVIKYKHLYDSEYLAFFGRTFIKTAFWSDSRVLSWTSDRTDDLNLI